MDFVALGSLSGTAFGLFAHLGSVLLSIDGSGQGVATNFEGFPKAAVGWQHWTMLLHAARLWIVVIKLLGNISNIFPFLQSGDMTYWKDLDGKHVFYNESFVTLWFTHEEGDPMEQWFLIWISAYYTRRYQRCYLPQEDEARQNSCHHLASAAGNVWYVLI